MTFEINYMEFNIGMKLKQFFLITFLILSTLISKQVFAQYEFSKGYEAAQSGNYKKAVQIWRSLAEKGDANAQYTLGWMYESGQGVKKDNKQAVHWYRKSALQGDASAQYILATMFEKGSGVEKSTKKALAFFKLAANQGDAISQFQVGNYYQHGIGTDKDNKKSVFWYKKSAKQGHITAQINLANMYQSGRGIEQSYGKAIQWYESAANQNNALAQYQLAHMYEYGRGEKQDRIKAIQLYTKSADNNYAPSAYKLGIIFELGQGIPIDIVQAETWYRQAALQGNTNAQFRLGHLSQTGVENNIQTAIEWYVQASRRNHAQAHYQLAEIYEYGTTKYAHNISKNLPKAFKHYQQASSLNYHLAHAKLAYFYEEGLSIEADQIKATTLYQDAPQDWAKLRLKDLIKHQTCLTTASTRLFGELISCINRPLLRRKITEQSIKVIDENNNAWSDTYYIGATIKGSSELTISYTRDDLFARASYTFVGRNNPQLIVQIKDRFAKRYGDPTSFKGDTIKGKASFQWTLKDNITLNIYRLWPDTTTFVEYIHPEYLDLQIKQKKESIDKLFRSQAQLARESKRAIPSVFL